MKLLSFDDLPAKGIPYHPQHIRKMYKAKAFPRPVKLGIGRNARGAFIESEIDAWIEAKIAERDAEAK